MALELSVEDWGQRSRNRIPHGSTCIPKWRRARLTTLLSMLIFGMTGVTQAAHPRKEHKRDYKREIEAVEQKWRTAQLSGDVATIENLLAEDYLGISTNGQINNKTQQLERLRTRTLVLTRIDASDVKIKLLGRVGIVTSKVQLEGTNDGQPLHGLYRYTRIYKRYPDGSWKITNFEVTQVPGRGNPGDPAD